MGSLAPVKWRQIPFLNPLQYSGQSHPLAPDSPDGPSQSSFSSLSSWEATFSPSLPPLHRVRSPAFHSWCFTFLMLESLPRETLNVDPGLQEDIVPSPS